MASEIRGFTDPGSLQAFGNLVSGEQMYDQMAQQRQLQGQNAMLAQQQMAQEYDLAQQRMAQGQQQFEAGLLEAGREREFRTAERAADQKFQMDQMAALQKWEQTKTDNERSFQLQLEELALQRQEAESKGLLDAVREINEREKELRRARAKNSTELASARMVMGQTARKARQMTLDYNSMLKQRLSATQAAQNTGSGFASSLVNGLRTRSKDESVSALSALRGKQWGDMLGLSARDLGSALTAAGLGEVPGAEFLILDSDMFASLKSFSPGRTITASFVRGEMDPADMTKKVQDRIFGSVVEATKGMGLKDESAIADALRLAATGGDKAQIAQKLIASGVDPTSLKAMLSNAAGQLESEERSRLQDLGTRYRSEVGGQDDMRTMAISAAQRALETQISSLRRMSNSIEITDVDDITAAIEFLDERIRAGELGGLADNAALRALGGSSSQLKDLLDAISESELAAQSAEQAAIRQGDIAEQEGETDMDNMLRMLIAQQAGTGVGRAGLSRIRSGLRP